MEGKANLEFMTTDMIKHKIDQITKISRTDVPHTMPYKSLVHQVETSFQENSNKLLT